jgi:transketolase
MTLCEDLKELLMLSHMSMNKELKKRIIDISYRHKLSHLSSCLTAVDIIKDIYDQKKDTDRFVLSSGHAGLALYVVLEEKGLGNAEEMFLKGGIHPDRITQPVDCSTGSLGHGLPIAVGMALADRNRDVHCLISDGECSEGSIFEALRIADEKRLTNLYVYVNINGYAAYKEIDRFSLVKMLEPYSVNKKFIYTDVKDFPFLEGLKGHYHIMSKEDYDKAMEVLGD